MTNAEARFSKSLRPRKPEGSLGRTAPGRPPRLSHSSWTMSCRKLSRHVEIPRTFWRTPSSDLTSCVPVKESRVSKSVSLSVSNLEFNGQSTSMVIPGRTRNREKRDSLCITNYLLTLARLCASDASSLCWGRGERHSIAAYSCTATTTIKIKFKKTNKKTATPITISSFHS